MKKILLSMILMFSFLFPFANANEIEKTDMNNATIIQWKLLSKQQAKATFWQPLDCQSENLQKYVKKSIENPELYLQEIENLKKTDPGQVKDIKGCTLERQMDSMVQWIVYIVIIGFVIWTVIIIGKSILWGWKSWGWWDSMGMGMDMGGWWGWWNDLTSQLKTPIIWIVILVLLILGILNVALKLVTWIFDSLV